MALEHNETGGVPAANVDSGFTSVPEGDELFAHGDASVLVASQWKLIWWRFRRHKLALFSAVVLILIYLVVLFAEFLAPLRPSRLHRPLHLRTTADAVFVRYG